MLDLKVTPVGNTHLLERIMALLNYKAQLM